MEFYFTSKVVTGSNEVKFQVHRVYSTEYTNSGNSFWPAILLGEGTRFTMMDDSIMPWKNNRNISTINWRGRQRYQGWFVGFGGFGL